MVDDDDDEEKEGVLLDDALSVARVKTGETDASVAAVLLPPLLFATEVSAVGFAISPRKSGPVGYL